MARVLIAAIVIELLVDVAFVLNAISANRSEIPMGALGRLALVGILGLAVFILRSRLACWLLAGFEWLTAVLCVAFSFATFPSLRPSFSPGLLAVGIGYVLVAVMMTIGAIRLPPRGPRGS
jgi:hypothetical protein